MPISTRAITTGCQGGMVHLALSNSSPIGTWALVPSVFFGGAGEVTGAAVGVGGGGVVGVSFSGIALLVLCDAERQVSGFRYRVSGSRQMRHASLTPGTCHLPYQFFLIAVANLSGGRQFNTSS